MDEMSKLREWRADAPAPDRERLAPGRRRLLDAAGARKRRRLPVLGDWRVVSGAVAAGVTAVALLTMSVGGGPGGEGGSPAAGNGEVAAQTPVHDSAPELLRRAADAVRDEPVPKPEAGEWVYLQTVEENDGVLGADSPASGEQWYKYADPEFEDWNEGDDHSPRERFEYLATLPEDTDEVLQKARWFYPENGGRPDSDNPGAGRSDEELAAWNFGSLRVLLASAPMHPVGQSRVYEAMATIPGLRVADSTVTDAAGRPALAFYRDAGVDDGFRDELLIDPQTYAYLGHRWVATETSDSRGDSKVKAKKGEVVTGSAVIRSALVDGDGVRP
ncbi:CU044_5270 family protein [Streptomyces sp. NBC_01808]|uniref:CU044_5270 family protein n=1 Tax=Streptomyces sp. NBC_01808 TaxID=2975947 RepID=UPI002DDA7A7E|nr:CU044_5270 family protein [Streptomyces sp. NBC_01808]WSA37114.1 CU044_5270 family protein [Streptomyces sp. NBC_01808]